MKAVLWTDVLQGLLMFFGVIVALIKGFLDVGFNDVFKIAKEGGRLKSPSLEINLYKRFTMWNMMINGVFASMSCFCANQVQVQRMLTLKNLNRSRWALYASIPLSSSFQLLICLTGIVVYAYFEKCDPLSPPNNPVQRGDQLLPYFMMKSLSNYPGLLGICICGIFSASISTVSSCVNSLTAVTMQDLIRPFLLSKGLSEGKLTILAQLITFFYGSLCIVLTFVFASVGSLVQLSVTIFGCLGGPVLGVFLLGMLTTRANAKGANVGFVIAIAMTSWIGFGVVAYPPPKDPLPVSTDGCPTNNSSLLLDFLNGTEYKNISIIHTVYILSSENSSSLNIDDDGSEYIFPLYRISFMWIVSIGFFLTCIIGYISSILINIINGETKEVAPELTSPIMKCFWMKKPTCSEPETNRRMNKEVNEIKRIC